MSRRRVFATLIRGGVLLFPDGDDGVRAETGDLLMEGDRITRLGAVDPVPRDARVIYAAGCAVLPGFVQSHVHLSHALFRGLADGLGLAEWMDRTWQLEASHTAQSLRASARLAVAELLLGGTTAVQTLEGGRDVGAILEVIAEAGLCAVVGRAMVDVEGSAPPELVQTTDEALRQSVDLAEEWDGVGDGRIRTCLAPRSPAHCTSACLREVGRLAGMGRWPIHVEAGAITSSGWRSGIEILAEHGLVDTGTGLAHCVGSTRAEMELVLQRGARVLHAPTADRRLGGADEAAGWLRAGVALSIGADSPAFGGGLGVFGQLRLLLQQQRPDSPLGPSRALGMATRAGARALGWSGEFGALEEGKLASVTLVSLDGIHVAPRGETVPSLAHACRSSDIRSVWLAGREVVSEGRLTLWDEEELRRDARREARALARRAGLA